MRGIFNTASNGHWVASLLRLFTVKSSMILGTDQSVIFPNLPATRYPVIFFSIMPCLYSVSCMFILSADVPSVGSFSAYTEAELFGHFIAEAF